MKVYLVQSPKDDGGNLIEVFSREGAIRIARKAWKQLRPETPDPRTDEDALMDFVIVHWAEETELLDG